MIPLRYPDGAARAVSDTPAAPLTASLLVHALVVGVLIAGASSTPPLAAPEAAAMVDIVLMPAVDSGTTGPNPGPADARDTAGPAEPTPPPAIEEPGPPEPSIPEPLIMEPSTPEPPIMEAPAAVPAPSPPPRKPRSRAPAQVAAARPEAAAAGGTAETVAPVARPEGTGVPDSAPRPIGGNPVPTYPRAAQRSGLQGTVLLRVTVGSDGRVASAEVIAGSGHAPLDAAAHEAVVRWRFVPAVRGGVPVPSVIEVPIRFELTRGRGYRHRRRPSPNIPKRHHPRTGAGRSH